MTKQEFEKLAMRNNVSIGIMLYESIEYFYMSTNEYHKYHGGIDESKQDFVNRVFNGKCNTSKSIANKLAIESIKENRYCLNGNQAVDKNRLDDMDNRIREHYQVLLKYNM